MKRLIALFLAVLLCLALAGCGSDSDNSAPAQGNESAFNLNQSHLQSVLACTWVNQDDFHEKIKFADDLSFTHYFKDEKLSGKATLNEDSGMLTLSYDDSARPEKTYIWVDSLSNAGANTWYVDGGTFSFGGVTYIKDMEI